MNREPFSITVRALAEAGRDGLPTELRSGEHLIYSSPATLAFNSPGAQGFGVKRAGLAIPESVMLLVAPGCCGRNTAALSAPEYRDRFFYLMMDETDLVTGRHLDKIPAACAEIVESLPKKPSSVLICITCVDALLGTDMDRVCRKASAAAGVPVLPCYMYALTREGRKPPMVAVQQTVYSLLEKLPRRADACNLLGFFAPLDDGAELYALLRQAGVRHIREVSRCETFEEYKKMGEANFNLVLHPEARVAAQDLEKRLGIPSVEVTRLYQLDKIQNQYRLLAAALGTEFDDEKYYKVTEQAVETLSREAAGAEVAIGEISNANVFELALALTRYGLKVGEIYGTVTDTDFVYLKKLAALSPETRVLSNLSPTMLHYGTGGGAPAFVIGEDAGYYHPGVPCVAWSSERQPFGYAGLTALCASLMAALKGAGQ